MAAFYSLICRADQTGRLPRDYTNFADRISAGAAVRGQMNFVDGSSVNWSNVPGDNADGVFTFDATTKIGWSSVPLKALLALPAAAFAGPAKWVQRIEDAGGAEDMMYGDARWTAAQIASPDDASATATDAGVGQTWLVLGEDAGAGNPVPVTLASFTAQAEASATAAAASETAAAASETAAAGSATAASASAVAAATSETNAGASATAAALGATAASGSATSASGSASAAAASETNAAASATAASGSAGAAATSETNAAASASAAATSETNAAASVTAAAGSASAASTSATNAGSSETAAAGSATAAATSASGAAASKAAADADAAATAADRTAVHADKVSADTDAATATTQAAIATAQAGIATAKADVATTQAGIATAAASAAAASAAYYLPVAGEVGVLNQQYPVGDVRRQGVFPDAVDLTGLTFTPGSAVVSSATNSFTQAMVGMRIALPINGTGGSKIISVAPNGSTATMANPAPAAWAGSTGYTSGTYVVSGGNIYQCISAHTSAGAIDTTKFQIVAPWPTAARVGTNWEADHSSYVAAIYANATNPLIYVYWPKGKYATSLNFNGSTSSGTRMAFWGCEFGLFHLIADNGFPGSGSALSDVLLTGDITVYDRFGSIGLLNSDLSRLDVRCKSDPTKNVNAGTYGRGCHIYNQIKNSSFGEIVIDDCGVGTALNSDAAFSMDTSDCTGNLFKRVWVKNAAGHGFLAYGPNNTYGEIRVDNFGYGTQDRGAQEAAATAQNLEFCGVWMRRCPGLKVETMRVGATGTVGANVAYWFRLEDTINSVAGGVYGTPRINSAFFTNVQARGVSIGDRNNLGSVGLSEVSFGQMHFTPISGATLSSGYSLVHVNANASPSNYGRNKLRAETIAVYNPSSSINDLLQCPVSTEIDVDLIDTEHNAGHAGRVFVFNGQGRIGRIKHKQAGGSGSPVPFTINGDGAYEVGTIDAQSPDLVTITAVDLSNAGSVNNARGQVGPINLRNYRGAPAVMVNGASDLLVKLGLIKETSAVGWGILIQNCTDVGFELGYITGFAKGTTGSAANNVRCWARGVQSTENTTNTDLANGQLLTDATCLNVTL